METITEIMLEEHKKIDEFLKDLERSYSDDKFNRFKWTLEKHFFVEEKAIFDLLNSIKSEEVSPVFDLMEEHGEIIELARHLGEVEDKKRALENLKVLLTKHSRFEDSMFYPNLDKTLNQNTKREIIEKTKEIIRV